MFSLIIFSKKLWVGSEVSSCLENAAAYHLEFQEDKLFQVGGSTGGPTPWEERLGFVELGLGRVRKHVCSAEILGILWSS